ncbi:MAG: sensor histidine kinase [Bacteroidetes bacterium]|nr:MAG: sensor histidine kinase [Bacteroidota bacterium]
MIRHSLNHILLFLFLLISVLQGIFFYNTYYLNRQQINNKLQQTIANIEQKIEQHEISRHKELFKEYSKKYLCAPEQDKFMDITFRLFKADTFNNLQELSETIYQKLSKQAINSTRFQVNQLPIDTNFIGATISNYLQAIDQNLNITYRLDTLKQQAISQQQPVIKLFDDYRFYAPLYLTITISGVNSFLFKQLFAILFSCIIILILFFFATRYTYLTLIKYKQLADSKTAFISHLAHEIKTPLSSIYISSQALRDSRISHENFSPNTYVHAIYFESQRLKKQLENVLYVSAAEKNFLTMNKKPTNINNLTLTVMQLFNKRILDAGGHMRLFVDDDAYTLNIDRTHFGNVIYNLIDNAIKYSQTRTLDIQIDITSNASNLIFKISDKGVGIPLTMQKNLFSMFYKAHQHISGFGVGLHYAKCIIEAHKGNISLASEVNVGTTFMIAIPL